MFLFLHQFVGEHTFALNTKKGTMGDVPLYPCCVIFRISTLNKKFFLKKNYKYYDLQVLDKSLNNVSTLSLTESLTSVKCFLI